MKLNQNWKLFILIYVFALVIRLGVIFLTPFQLQDTGYLEVAQNLKNYGTFFQVINDQGAGQIWNGTYYANTPPFYPFFIAFFSNKLFLLSLWQAFVYSFLPLLVYPISNILFSDKKIALVSALFSCVYPYFVYSSDQLIDTGLACLIFCLLILSNLVYAEKAKGRYLLLAGVINAMGLLTRQNFLTIMMAFPFYDWFTLKNSLPNTIKKYYRLFMVTLLFLAPWLIRNFIILRKPVITSYYGGYTFWLGNNRSTHQCLSAGIVDDIESYIFLTKKDCPYFENLNEIQKEDWLMQKGMDFIKNNPIESLENGYLKFIRLWALEKENSHLAIKWKNLLYLVVTFPLFLFSVLGLLILYRQNKRLAIFFLVLFFAFSLPFVIFISSIRMRIPFDVLLISLSSFFLVKASNIFPLKNIMPTNPNQKIPDTT